jgi:hypothetical protein
MDKTDKLIWGIFIIMIVAGMIFAYYYILKGKNVATINNPSIDFNSNISQQQVIAECDVSVNPIEMCSGDYATGTIKTFRKETLCSIFLSYNNLPKNLLGNVLTDLNGDYSTSQQLTFPGKYELSINCGKCTDSVIANVGYCTTPVQNTTQEILNTTDDYGGRPPCATIINPQSQTDCDAGYCVGIHYGCQYHLADLTHATAYCACI